MVVPADASPELARLAAEIRRRYPRFRVAAKERSRLMRLAAALMPFNRGFMTSMTTTIGYVVYMPAAVRRDPSAGPRILRHERVHIDQFRRHPLWFPFSYLFVAPAFVTMRARWELEAYVESMRAELDETGSIDARTVDAIARLFTGPQYLFMDVRSRRVRRRLHDARAALLSEQPA